MVAPPTESSTPVSISSVVSEPAAAGVPITASLPDSIPGSTPSAPISIPTALLPDGGSASRIQPNPSEALSGSSLPVSVPAVSTPIPEPVVGTEPSSILDPNATTPIGGVTAPGVTSTSNPVVTPVEILVGGASTPVSHPASTPASIPVLEPTLGVPTVVDTARANYSGCYEDVIGGSGVSLLNGSSLTGQTNLTIESCQIYCTSGAPGGPYRWFGLESGSDCHCGMELQHDAIPVDGSATDCTTPCSGDPTEKCGASNLLSAYANNDFLSLPVMGELPSSSVPVTEPVSTPIVTIPVDNGSVAPVQTTPSAPIITPVVPAPSDSGIAAPDANEPSLPVITDVPIPTDSGVVAPLPGPSSVRLPLADPYPNRPPSEVGDGVDPPYFFNAPWQPRPYPPNNGGNEPRPTKKPNTPSYATRKPWKSRPTARPWESGNGYRAERRWFGLW